MAVRNRRFLVPCILSKALFPSGAERNYGREKANTMCFYHCSRPSEADLKISYFFFNLIKLARASPHIPTAKGTQYKTFFFHILQLRITERKKNLMTSRNKIGFPIPF